jgi:hypothetical protein
MRRSTVLGLPFQLVFPVKGFPRRGGAIAFLAIFFLGGGGGIRTLNLWIVSRVLYHCAKYSMQWHDLQVLKMRKIVALLAM